MNNKEKILSVLGRDNSKYSQLIVIHNSGIKDNITSIRRPIRGNYSAYKAIDDLIAEGKIAREFNRYGTAIYRLPQK